MKKIIATALLATGFSMAPAFAGVSDFCSDGPPTGGTHGRLEINYSYAKRCEYNFIRREVYRFLGRKYQIEGHGSVDYRWTNGVDYEKDFEVFLSDSYCEGVAEMASQIRSWVNCIPGRRWKYWEDITTKDCDSYITQCIENTYLGSTFDTEVTADISVSDDAIYCGDPEDYNNLTVHQGLVTVDVTETTVETKNFDQLVTTEETALTCVMIDIGKIVSPIVLDLDGDGSLDASGGEWLPHESYDNAGARMFDFDGNGIPVMMEWTGANDGILVKPHADGRIDGKAFFGTANGHDNGYDALSMEDANGDMVISGEELAGLKVWQDKNRNTVVDAGELNTLDSLGITSLSLNHNNFVSSYTRNGDEFKMFDWFPRVFEIRKMKVSNGSI